LPGHFVRIPASPLALLGADPPRLLLCRPLPFGSAVSVVGHRAHLLKERLAEFLASKAPSTGRRRLHLALLLTAAAGFRTIPKLLAPAWGIFR